MKLKLETNDSGFYLLPFINYANTFGIKSIDIGWLFWLLQIVKEGEKE